MRKAETRLKKQWRILWWLALVPLCLGTFTYFEITYTNKASILFIAIPAFMWGFITARLSYDVEISYFEAL